MAAPDAGRDARTRRPAGRRSLAVMLLPALTAVIGLFGGGLFLGVLQGLGHLPGAGLSRLSGAHFNRVLSDPDFFTSLGLTLFIAAVSTFVAAVISVVLPIPFAPNKKRYLSS